MNKKLLMVLILSVSLAYTGCKEKEKGDVKPAPKEEAVKADRDETDPVKALINDLDSVVLNKRKIAMEKLTGMGEVVVEPLLDAVQNSTYVRQTNALTVIEKVDPKWSDRKSAVKAVQYFINELANENGDKRSKAESTLELIGEPALDLLIMALINEDMNIAKSVGNLIMKIDMYWVQSERGRKAIPVFIDALKNENHKVRSHATKALIRIGHGAFDELIHELFDEDIEYQKHIVYILGRIDEKWISSAEAAEYIPLFIDSLKSEKESVRLRAAEILGGTGSYEAIEPLINALDDDFLYTRKAAEDSLKNITGEDFGDDKEKWLAWFKENNPTPE